MKHIQPGTLIILGKEDEDFRQQVKAAGIPYFDILKEESFFRTNAIPRAEGAIQRAMETDITYMVLMYWCWDMAELENHYQECLKASGQK